MKATEVGAVMTTDVVTVAHGTPLEDVVRALAEHPVDGLPVTDDEDRVIGVVSTSDLARPARAPGGSSCSAACPASAGPAPWAT